MDVELDQDLLYTALQYHGPKLQEALGSELNDVGVYTGRPGLNFPTYTNGHNTTNDLDHEKQSKLQKFIVDHSKAFFSIDLLPNIKQKQCEDFETNSFTVMPPYEVFGYTNKEMKLKHFFNELTEGEIIITSISSKAVSGLILKVLCTYTEPIRCVSDINVRGFCPASIPGLSVGDNLCCEVLEVVPESCKLVCGTKGVKCHKKYKDLLGLFNMDNCPQTFKLFHAGKNDDSYDSMLQDSTGFKNPSNIGNLELITGLSDDRYSILPALSGSFPDKEVALELRKVQSAQWAIQSVSDGIKFYKSGQHSEAFLCLNKALTIDSLNVEAYVARGALYANLSHFEKAIDDLRTAIKINPKHVNGRKYLGETLMGYARTLESENKLEEALKYYEECAQVIPDHDEAKASIEFAKSTLQVGRTMSSDTFENSTKKKIDADFDFEKSASSSSSSNNSNSSSSDSSSSGSSSDDDSNSSSDSDSDHSSSSDSSSDGSSGNESQKLEKERSLSPFSKRLAMMEGNSTNGGGLPCNPSFVATENSQSQQLNVEKESDIEARIQKLLILSQSKGKKSKQIGLNLQKLLQDAYALKNEEKKSEKKMKKSKDKKKSHKHKKKDSKTKQKGAKDQDHHHKKNKSKKHKFTEQSLENEQQVAQKSSLPDPESVKSNLSNLKETIFFKKYVKQDKPNDQNIINKENEQSDMFKANENIEMPNTYKYVEDPSLIPTPSLNKFKMQIPTPTTTFVKPKKKEPTDNSLPYNWDNNRLPPNHELMRTQTSNNNETHNVEHTSYPTSYDMSNNKGYFNLPLSTHPVPENNMEFQQKPSYTSPNNKERSRSRSASKRRITYSRSRSSGARSSQSPFKKKPKEASKSKSRSRSGSYPRHRRYSSSRSNRSRSSSRSYSRSRSRSRSMYHRNRMPYYNNRNRGTYYKPRFQNQNHHNRGFQNRGFQHRGGYVHRQNYNNYGNNWNNRGQRGGGRPRFFHYRPRQYDRNRHYERRSYSASPNRRSRSRTKSRSGSRNSSKEYNRKRYSGSEDQQHVANNKPKTPPEPTTETKWQIDSTDNNGNRNSQDHDEGSIE